MHDGIDDNDHWFLVRSGIVSVQGPDDAGAAGLTGNATLEFSEGSGINITRSGANFTIGLVGTHHNSDAEDFTPGWAYSFYDIENDSEVGTRPSNINTRSFREL